MLPQFFSIIATFVLILVKKKTIQVMSVRCLIKMLFYYHQFMWLIMNEKDKRSPTALRERGCISVNFLLHSLLFLTSFLHFFSVHTLVRSCNGCHIVSYFALLIQLRNQVLERNISYKLFQQKNLIRLAHHAFTCVLLLICKLFSLPMLSRNTSPSVSDIQRCCTKELSHPFGHV
jgi:hypothetical protein